jgi:hypothetical protein
VQVPEHFDTNPSEQNSNRTELEPELEDEDAAPSAPAAAAVPESVERLHELLFGQAGYDPSPAFLQKLATKYGGLDLEAEALKMLSWLPSPKNKRNQTCSTRFVLNWLASAATEPVRDRPTSPRASAGPAISGTKNDSRNPRDYLAAVARR